MPVPMRCIPVSARLAGRIAVRPAGVSRTVSQTVSRTLLLSRNSLLNPAAPGLIPASSIHTSSLLRPKSSSLSPSFFTPLARVAPLSSPNARSASTASPQTDGTPTATTEKTADPKFEFERTARASQAARLNLAARLSKDGSGKTATSGDWADIWRLLKIAAPEKKPLSLAFGCLIVSSSVSMSMPFAVGKILDMASKTDGTPDLVLGLEPSMFFLGLGAVFTVGAIANFCRIVQLRIVGERIVSRLRSRLYRQTIAQDAEFFDANRVGDLISRLGSDTIIVGKSITQNLSDGLRSFVSGAAGLTLMAYVSLKLTGILALMFPPIAIGAFFYGRAIRALSRRIQKNIGSLTKVAEERLGNIKTIQAFAGESQEVHRYNRQIRKIFNLGRKEALLSATFFGLNGFAGNSIILLMLTVGAGMVKSGSISVGELTSFMMYTAYAGSSMFGLSGFYSELMKGVGAASRLFELQDRKPVIHQTKGEPVKSLRGPIQFQNVHFAYPTRPAVQIFKEMTFTVEQGSHIAVVAPSGAGKSTVASLLLRFYDASSGTILINGQDISKMNAKQLRRRIGYVGQEPVLFSGTIAENIAYGQPDASPQAVLLAARQANCGFIADFPDGLDTFVGARGTQLSGGQKQRIAIARALLKQPELLILDEATSALDAESETLVNQALASFESGGAGTTIISIAHRLSTIKRSDRVICLGPDGRVVEEGPYEVLAGRDGPFKQLMEWQMHGTEMPAVAGPHRHHAGEVTEAEVRQDDHEREREMEEEEEEEEEEEADDGKKKDEGKNRS